MDNLDRVNYMLKQTATNRQEHEEITTYRGQLHLTKKFKDVHVKKMRDKFKLFETQRGIVDIEKIGGLMRACGLKVSDKEGYRIAADFNLPIANKIQFSEFMVMLGTNLPEFDENVDSDMSLSLIGQVDRRELREAFQVFDPENNGRISTRFLRVIVTFLGEPLDDNEVNYMIRNADPDGTGMVDIDKFVEFLCGEASSAENQQPPAEAVEAKSEDDVASIKSEEV